MHYDALSAMNHQFKRYSNSQQISTEPHPQTLKIDSSFLQKFPHILSSEARWKTFASMGPQNRHIAHLQTPSLSLHGEGGREEIKFLHSTQHGRRRPANKKQECGLACL